MIRRVVAARGGRAMIDHLPELDFRPGLPKLRPTNKAGQRRANALAPDTEG